MRYGLVMVLILVVGTAWGQKADKRAAKWRALEAEADTLAAHGDYTGAVKRYTQIINGAAGNSGPLLYKRAVALYCQGDLEPALTDVNAYISTHADDLQAKFLRAIINRDLGDAEAQLPDLNDILAANPLNPELMQWKAGVLMETGDYAGARTILNDLNELQPTEALEFYLGLSYYYSGDADSALIHFDKAIQRNGGYVPAYLYAGVLCVEQQAYDLALSYINLGLRLEPDNLELIFYKGVTLVEKGNLDMGCSCLNKAFYGGIDDAEGYLTEYCYPSED